MEVPGPLSVGREGGRKMEQGQSRGVFSTGVIGSEVSCSVGMRFVFEREPFLSNGELVNMSRGCVIAPWLFASSCSFCSIPVIVLSRVALGV